MQKNIISVCSTVLLLVGCTHTNNGDMRFLPDQYVNTTEYDSLYHYGYNQGCDSALAKAQVVGYSYTQDVTLNSTSSRFSDGWQQGYSACEVGKEILLYNLSKTR
ncbi:hypothetical protein [Photobacterium toruni]|uniref:Lipoprotein n=1 Tax=Photobacterium toruni TaxID=1935446 RepID=A0A1T4QDC6_9GAMM|nr:hypothetical protein [Photobacterium toruni]MEC6815209.1 hypothetical protein [Photobacterium toruni]MEC6830929.1 hypothetical protein [Photobacterium toruni]SKA01695.1 hypothetical protein CZ814_01001 [Photobacterium toruni]